MNQSFANKFAVKASGEHPEQTLVEVFLGLSSDPDFHTRLLLHEADAKQLALLLRRVLKMRETQQARVISLTAKQWETMGVSPDDW